MNVYDIEVSYFDRKTHSAPDMTVNLLEICMTDKYKQVIELLRSFPKGSKEFDEIKEELPCFTPSAICNIRERNGIIHHTNILSLDFDNINDVEALKTLLEGLNFIMFVSLSCSGTGLFALIKIEKPNLHKQYFDYLVDYFAKLGIEIDKSGSDITRLRFVSFDNNFYLNEDSDVWDTMLLPKTPTYHQCKYRDDANINTKIIYLVHDYVVQRGIDITIGRNKWLTIGSFIGQTLGASGKVIFRDISQFHPKFNENECDKTFDSVSTYEQAIGLGAFLNICKDNHIPDIKELLRR